MEFLHARELTLDISQPNRGGWRLVRCDAKLCGNGISRFIGYIRKRGNSYEKSSLFEYIDDGGKFYHPQCAE